MEMEEKNLAAAGASKAAVADFLTGYGYRAAHLSKGRWYATADLAGVKGRNIFWFNPGRSRPPAESGAPAGDRPGLSSAASCWSEEVSVGGDLRTSGGRDARPTCLKQADEHLGPHDEKKEGEDALEFVHRQAVGQADTQGGGEDTGGDDAGQGRQIHIPQGVSRQRLRIQAVDDIAHRPGDGNGEADGRGGADGVVDR